MFRQIFAFFLSLILVASAAASHFSPSRANVSIAKAPPLSQFDPIEDDSDDLDDAQSIMPSIGFIVSTLTLEFLYASEQLPLPEPPVRELRDFILLHLLNLPPPSPAALSVS